MRTNPRQTWQGHKTKLLPKPTNEKKPAQSGYSKPLPCLIILQQSNGANSILFNIISCRSVSRECGKRRGVRTSCRPVSSCGGQVLSVCPKPQEGKGSSISRPTGAVTWDLQYAMPYPSRRCASSLCVCVRMWSWASFRLFDLLLCQLGTQTSRKFG